MEESCKSCRFFLDTDEGAGVCRRHPAVPVAVGDQVYSHFPVMLDSGWCGEYKLKVSTNNE